MYVLVGFNLHKTVLVQLLRVSAKNIEWFEHVLPYFMLGGLAFWGVPSSNLCASKAKLDYSKLL